MGEGGQFNLASGNEDQKSAGSFNSASGKLMAGDRETGRSLVDNFEQLHELSLQIKSKGRFTPEDVSLALLLVNRTAECLESGAEDNIIRDSTFDISDYEVSGINESCVEFMDGKLFFDLRDTGMNEHTLKNISGESINKYPCHSVGFGFGRRPFYYKNQLIFQFGYVDKHDGVASLFVNEKGKDVGLPNSNDDFKVLLKVLDDKRNLVCCGTSLVSEGGKDYGQLFTPDGNPVTDSNQHITFSRIVDGQLSYLSEDTAGNIQVVCGSHKYSSSDELNKLDQLVFSGVFLWNGRKCFIRTGFDQSFDMGNTQVIDIETSEVLHDNDSEKSSITEIHKYEVVDDKVYVHVTRDGQKMVLIIEGQKSHHLMLKDEKTEVSDIQKIAGEMVYFIRYSRDGGLPPRYGVQIDGKTELQSDKIIGAKVLATDKPKEVLGSVGQIFHIGIDMGNVWLMVDDDPILLGDVVLNGQITMFDIANDVLFWNHYKVVGSGKFRKEESRLVIDGTPSIYVYDKILKVVFHEGKYFVVAVNGTDMVVREIKI